MNFDSMRTVGSSPLARGTHPGNRHAGVQRRFIPAGAGNTAFALVGLYGEDGSSPLARGTRAVVGAHLQHPRFIPAGAGNTCSQAKHFPLLTVHPRWRGEHSGSSSARRGSGGSSPLARGTGFQRLDDRGIRRFIPAGAGNTTRHAEARRERAVHPRWRGEHLSTCPALMVTCGSSPLARGTQVDPVIHDVTGRFIPAGAGNTVSHGPPPRAQTVHPRWRGEHATIDSWAKFPDGSSPLARGTREWFEWPSHLVWFIPAGAGNTRRVIRNLTMPTVHPRWRGEHPAESGPLRRLDGSSPLARGTPVYTQQQSLAVRFIPAGAGNTKPLRRSPASRTVHPRWRGEHRMLGQQVAVFRGSSPLARGTQCR